MRPTASTARDIGASLFRLRAPRIEGWCYVVQAVGRFAKVATRGDPVHTALELSWMTSDQIDPTILTSRARVPQLFAVASTSVMAVPMLAPPRRAWWCPAVKSQWI